MNPICIHSINVKYITKFIISMLINENLKKLFAFVLMPFDKQKRDIYQLGIKEPCASIGVLAERVDEQMYSEGILERIYGQIQKADFIIAELTEKNPNVFYELGYAQALKKICLLLTKDAKSIPFDLRHLRHIVYDDISSLKEQLIQNIEWIKKDSVKRGGREINEIHPLVNPINICLINGEVALLPLYRYQLIKNILKDAGDEVKCIMNGTYSLDIGLERSFLLRAEPIFRNAKSIYAVSLSWVSEFWLDKENFDLSRKYLNSQPEQTNRLFVFSSPDEANQFKNILKANYAQYGASGGVYLCSIDDYKKLLSDIGISGSKMNKYFEKDFGFLKYDYEGLELCVEAQLDNTKLEFREIDTQKSIFNKVIETFNNLANLGKDGNISKSRVYKWHPELYTNHVRWAEVLSDMFGDRSRSIYHFVFFREIDDDLNKTIQELKYELDEIKKRLSNKCDIDIIWFGKWVDAMTKDGRYYGKIEVSNKYKYVLVMRFPSLEDIEVYYKDQRHSECRENLYSKLDANIKHLYALIKNNEYYRSIDNMEKLFAAIEGLSTKYVVRMDFEDYENIEEIAKKEGAYFSA